MNCCVAKHVFVCLWVFLQPQDVAQVPTFQRWRMRLAVRAGPWDSPNTSCLPWGRCFSTGHVALDCEPLHECMLEACSTYVAGVATFLYFLACDLVEGIQKRYSPKRRRKRCLKAPARHRRCRGKWLRAFCAGDDKVVPEILPPSSTKQGRAHAGLPMDFS